MEYSNITDLRAARDQALKDSDFYILEDVPLTEPREVKMALIKIYRQELRNITVGVTTTNIISHPVELPTLILPN